MIGFDVLIGAFDKLWDCVYRLFTYYTLQSIIISIMFMYCGYRFFLYPILGGRMIEGGSDKVKKSIKGSHND